MFEARSVGGWRMRGGRRATPCFGHAEDRCHECWQVSHEVELDRSKSCLRIQSFSVRDESLFKIIRLKSVTINFFTTFKRLNLSCTGEGRLQNERRGGFRTVNG